MSINPYAPPNTALSDISTIPSPIYSPGQIGAGTLLGGPVAAVYFLYANYSVMNLPQKAYAALLYGTILILITFGVSFILPDNFPGSIISFAWVFTASYVAKTLQLTKQQIESSPEYAFQSNWRVTVIALACLLLTVLIIAGGFYLASR